MSIYSADYFLSDACEGYEDYQAGTISLVKQKELELLDAAPGGLVLDLGCGRGEVMAELHRRGVDVVGIDYSEDALTLSADLLDREQAPRRLGRCDAARLPFADDSFDRVLMGDVIEHLEWEHGEVALQEVRRVLKPEGVALVHTAPNLWFVRFVLPVVRLLLRLLGKKDVVARIDDYSARRAEVHPNELSIIGLRRMVNSGGLTGRIWIDRDVLRAGASTWTASIGQGRLMRLVGRVAGLPPFRWFLGNDLYALVRPQPD